MDYSNLLNKKKIKNYYNYYKRNFPNLRNDISNLISYDKQAGTYINFYKTNKGKIYNSRYCKQLYSIIFPFLKK